MSHTILIVDREVGLRHIIEQALQRAGFDTQVANEGNEALVLLSSHKPCVIIVDDDLEGMSGGQFCRKVKMNPDTRHIPVIIHSNSLRVFHETYLKTIRADAAMRKPAPVYQLLEMVQSFTGIQSQRAT